MNKVLNKSGELDGIITKISSKNQFTIPVSVIKQKGLSKNQRVKVIFDKSKSKTLFSVEILPDPIAKLRGILKGKPGGVKEFLKDRYEDDKYYN